VGALSARPSLETTVPTFTSSQPIAVSIDLQVGNARITASERTDTVVEVRPREPGNEADVRAAEATEVDFSSGRLVVRGPHQRALLFRRPGAVEVTIELPQDSHVEGKAEVGAIRTAGRLGRCRIRAGVGDVELEHAGELRVQTGAGAINVERVSGPADISTGTGTIRVGGIDGSAKVKNSNGDSWIGAIAGDLHIRSANGQIAVQAAGGNVAATTANGALRVGGLTRGNAVLKTANGEIEVGVRDGTAARLDVLTRFGRVDNRMEPAEGPAAGDERIDVQARTAYGDIVVRRD
jgi:DUF4097 and DUF4098 domain-containing protein YvlB